MLTNLNSTDFHGRQKCLVKTNGPNLLLRTFLCVSKMLKLHFLTKTVMKQFSTADRRKYGSIVLWFVTTNFYSDLIHIEADASFPFMT